MTILQRPIYLHLFDRELWESVGQKPNRSSIDRALKSLIVGSSAPLYCGLSLVWENPALRSANNQIDPIILKLIELGVIEPISQYPTVEEFIHTRRDVYKHDQSRYPLYFDSSAGIGPPPAHIKSSSATQHLSSFLYDWSQPSHQLLSSESDVVLPLRRTVRSALDQRDDRAITFSLFRAHLEGANLTAAKAEYAVRRQISKGYTTHYMQHASGDIPTGISELSFFDALGRSFPDYDVHLIERLLIALDLSEELKRPFGEHEIWWAKVAARRSRDFVSRLAADDLKFILRAVHAYCIEALGGALRGDDLFGIRNIVATAIGSKCSIPEGSMPRVADDFFDSLAQRLSLARGRIENDREMRHAVDTVTEQMGRGLPRILLVTATTIERDALLRLSKQIVRSPPIQDFKRRRAYFRLGQIGGVEVVTIQSEMGSVGPGASLTTIADAIDDFSPSAVIMVGVAFGVDEKKQGIGEIIVSRQLLLYEAAKVATSPSDGSLRILPRGDKITASTVLLGRFRLAEVGWSGKKARFGLMLSGEKLIDNVDYRDRLRSLGDQIEGGEMEGAGLYSAAAERKVEWIIVKAICDWADGNKRRNKTRRQTIAAEQAVGFVLHALQQGGFASIQRD
jgi:nucleoside phosphorylase